jgi:hypothetical protein
MLEMCLNDAIRGWRYMRLADDDITLKHRNVFVTHNDIHRAHSKLLTLWISMQSCMHEHMNRALDLASTIGCQFGQLCRPI